MFFTKKNTDRTDKPFVEHLEDLRWLIVRSLVAILLVSIVVFFKIEYLFDHIVLGPAHSDFITYKILCRVSQYVGLKDALCLENVQLKLQSTQMSSQFMMSFSMAFVVGFIVAFPYIIYLLWKFIRPALQQQEVKKIRYIVFWISLLFFFGVAFGYFVITPYTVNFFASYTLSPLIDNNFLLSDYIDTVMQLVVGTGIVFQLPLVIYVLAKIGIVSATFLKNNRKYAVVVVLVVAAVITPPDVFSQLLVTLPLWILYEIGILIALKIERNAHKEKR